MLQRSDVPRWLQDPVTPSSCGAEGLKPRVWAPCSALQNLSTSPGSCPDHPLSPEGPKCPPALARSHSELTDVRPNPTPLCISAAPAPPAAAPGASSGQKGARGVWGKRAGIRVSCLPFQVNAKAGKWPYPGEGAEFKSAVIFSSNFGMENAFRLNELVSSILLKSCSLKQLVK